MMNTTEKWLDRLEALGFTLAVIGLMIYVGVVTLTVVTGN